MKMWDYAGVVEVTIGRPAKDVWPHFFGDKKDIWSKSDYTTIAGESGQVGEIYSLEHHRGHLFYEALKVEPEKQLVLKITYKENEKDERNLVGYDLITLNEVALQTTVVLWQVAAFPVEPEIDLNLKTETHDKFLADIFQNLKSMVEGSQPNR